MFLQGKKYGLNVLDFMLTRQILFFMFSIPALIIAKKVPFRDEPTGSIKFMIFRLCFGITTTAFTMWAVTYIPIALSTVVINLAPFWTAVLAFFINKEAITLVEIVCMIVCFLCVVGLTLSHQEDKTN
jgi:drug/metabolite transporter (DMT)-like permease